MFKHIDIEKQLNDDFEQASKRVHGLINVDNSVLLELYSYFKQVTIGDNTRVEPSFLDFKLQAKWNAWNKCKGMKKQTAQVKYIKLVARLLDNN